MWCFAIGQFGWSLLSALITNWLVYFYQPDADSIAAGQTLFIPQGRVILGIATVIGGIAALGRVFDAVTDPMIATKNSFHAEDRDSFCTHHSSCFLGAGKRGLRCELHLAPGHTAPVLFVYDDLLHAV